MKVYISGSELIGAAMAGDLSEDFNIEVKIYDINGKLLQRLKIQII